MPTLTRRNALLVALSLAVCSRVALAGESAHELVYHSWHIDASRVPDLSREAVMGPVQKQLDKIESFGIAQDIVLFMRTVPLHVDPALDAGTPARYSRDKGVQFRLDTLDPKKPVLLHELLRAFHEQKLGYGDKTILKAFEQARASGAWPADADMLKSVQNFFAATATVYLFGSIDTPPFTQGKLRELQPDYWQHLGEVFDGFRGCE